MRNTEGEGNEFLWYRHSWTRGDRGVSYGDVVLCPKKMGRWVCLADLGYILDRPPDVPRQAGFPSIRRTAGCPIDTRVASTSALVIRS